MGKNPSHELREYWPQYCKRFWKNVFSYSVCAVIAHCAPDLQSNYTKKGGAINVLHSLRVWQLFLFLAVGDIRCFFLFLDFFVFLILVLFSHCRKTKQKLSMVAKQ